MVGTLAAAAIIVLASSGLGRGYLRLCRAPAWDWTAPAVGLALAVVVAPLAIKLPGDGATAAVLLGLAAAAGLLAPPWRKPEDAGRAALTAALVFAATLLPFLINARFGLLGMSFNDDANRHLPAIESLRIAGEVPSSVFGISYPTAPHALMAAVATVVRSDQALDGLLIAIPILTALAALPLFEGRRAVAGASVSGLAYLATAYFVSAAFKETLMALLVLAFAVCLQRCASPFALAALAAACAATYSYPGLAWPLGTLALWAVLELARRPDRRAAGLAAARTAAPAAILALVLILPAVRPALSLFDTVGLSPAGSGAVAESNLGYTNQELSPAQALGVWPSGDYRVDVSFAPAGWLAGALGLLALGYGLVWAVRRRELALPAAIVTCVVIYGYFRLTQSPWISAKALVILSPLAVAVAARALLAPRAPAWRTALAVVFIAGCAGSSLLHLRTAKVEPPGHRDELRSFARVIGEQPVLLLTLDDYAAWRLTPAIVTEPGANAPVRPEKRYQGGDPVDFDSAFPQTVADHRWMITSRAAYASAPSPGWRVVRRTPSYLLWRRDGDPPPRATLPEGAAPGANLDCTARPPGRAAMVTAAPVEAALPRTLDAGESVTATLALPAGRWALSLQYQSPRALTLSPGGSVPASLDRLGSFWAAGEVTGGGPTRITISMPGEALPGLRRRTALLGRLAATRVEQPQRIPLRQACTRYVDWLVP